MTAQIPQRKYRCEECRVEVSVVFPPKEDVCLTCLGWRRRVEDAVNAAKKGDPELIEEIKLLREVVLKSDVLSAMINDLEGKGIKLDAYEREIWEQHTSARHELHKFDIKK